MKNRTITKWIFPLLTVGILIMAASGCKKDEKVPSLTTVAINTITQTTATSGGNITSDGGATITACGVCWSTNLTPTIADNKTTEAVGSNNFTSSITELMPSTTYYVRAYATNSVGTSYGNSLQFTTASITDIDGNIYHQVNIGTQVWMVENLKTTHYRNGDPITNVTDNNLWENLTSGAYCNYENNTNNAANYGRLYNWYAVKDPRNIAPIGWHVPSDSEWQILIDYLGGNDVAGTKLKESGTVHWQNVTSGADNSSGFTALPGGCHDGMNTFVGNHEFYEINICGFWWSATENTANINCVWVRCMASGSGGVSNDPYNKNMGFSVRCIKD